VVSAARGLKKDAEGEKSPLTPAATPPSDTSPPSIEQAVQHPQRGLKSNPFTTIAPFRFAIPRFIDPRSLAMTDESTLLS
nr:hypothetical protein [Tanacetum cinerariifolium]